jgi:N-formylglutamate deformylase
MAQPFIITPAKNKAVPILLSVPHCGTEFPPELATSYKPELSKAPDDTDWFVDKLYDFASEMGIVVISARYSRWVIDLNRDPQSKPLYNDGRIITGLCPTTNFLGDNLYTDERSEIGAAEIERRLAAYYRPYHAQIQAMLDSLKNEFENVLLWDCHSIRQLVPTIYNTKFPDLILGDADRSSASSALIDYAMTTLKQGKYSISHNHPFKGGYITRHFGAPESGQHALQLEMTKINYMDDSEIHYDKGRAENMRALLAKTLETVCNEL